MAERNGRITPAQSDAFIADLGKLGIERDDEAPDRAFTYLLALCRTHRLTSYDAIYLDWAILAVHSGPHLYRRKQPPWKRDRPRKRDRFMPRAGNISLAALDRYAHWKRSFLCQRCGTLTEQDRLFTNRAVGGGS